jgi:Tol biopolymer transport system component
VGALPVGEALSIARQIAEALETAHDKGIIHRDLKPQNIKLTPDGQVKVLDFGLAKAMEPAGASPTASPTLLNSPTLTAQPGTQLGVILGTAAYMAPEQARGKAVDKRADIWAFGVVLYEMLTGTSLFAEETVSDTLAGVLKTEVDLGRLPEATPPAIRRLLRRCLDRDPKRRLHDIADARIVIDEVLAGAESLEGPAHSAPTEPAPLARRFAPWAALFLALGVLAGWLARSPSSGPEESAASTPALRRLTEIPGLETHPDISPDGRQFVYTSAASGNNDIYLMRVDGSRAINLTASSPAHDEQAAFSPDGESIAFRSERDGGGLFVMGATGESVRRLTNFGYDPAWSPDGKRLAFSTEGVIDPYVRLGPAELWIVEVATGKTRQLPLPDAVQPAWSPDGRRIAYWANHEGQRDLWIVTAEGGDRVAVTDDEPTDWSPEWSPDGRWLYFSSDRAGSVNLFRLPIDPETGRAISPPEPVTSSTGQLGYGRLSADGRRMVVSDFERTADLHVYRLNLEAASPLEPLRTLRPRTVHWCAPSPDSAWFACSTIGTPEDLVLLRSDGSELRRLTHDVAKDRGAAWSPDGERLLFSSTRDGLWEFYTLRADGSEPHRLTELGGANVGKWTPDGQSLTLLLIANRRRGEVNDPVVQVAASGLATPENAETLALPPPIEAFLPGGWSPSGRFLAGTDIAKGYKPLSVGAIEPATGLYHASDLPLAREPYGGFVGWLDDERYIARGATELAIVNAMNGTWRGLAPIEGDGAYLSLTDGGRLLVQETLATDGDIWLLEWGNDAE